VHQSYSKPKVGRFLRHCVDYTSHQLCTPVTPFPRNPADRRCGLSSTCRKRTEPRT